MPLEGGALSVFNTESNLTPCYVLFPPPPLPTPFFFLFFASNLFVAQLTNFSSWFLASSFPQPHHHLLATSLGILAPAHIHAQRGLTCLQGSLSKYSPNPNSCFQEASWCPLLQWSMCLHHASEPEARWGPRGPRSVLRTDLGVWT